MRGSPTLDSLALAALLKEEARQLAADAALAATLEEEERLPGTDTTASDAALAASLQLEEEERKATVGDSLVAARFAAMTAREALMEGLLEKKPVRGPGLVERAFGGGWRKRRVVLRAAAVEWHHGDEDDHEPQQVPLGPVGSMVREGGDPGDEHRVCLTVRSEDGEDLVLKAADERERDVWIRAVGRRIEQLKAASFAAAAADSERRMRTLAAHATAGALRRARAREGVRLLLERFFSPRSVCALEHEAFPDTWAERVHSVVSQLLPPQARATQSPCNGMQRYATVCNGM